MVLGTAMQTYGEKLDRRAGSALATPPTSSSTPTRAESAVLRAAARRRRRRLHAAAAARVRQRRRGPRRDRRRAPRSRRWPTATRCARCSRRCAACSRSRRSTPSRCAGSSPMRSSRGRDILSERSAVSSTRNRPGASRLPGAVVPASCCCSAAACSAPREPVRRGDRRVAAPRRTSSCASRRTSPVPAANARAFPPLRYFPIDRGVPRAGGAERRSRADQVLEMPTSTGQRRQHAARRHAGVHAEGAAADADRVRRGDRDRHAAAVRAVRRSDQRHRDLSGRPLPRPRSHRDRRLRSRLQPRLSSVLLLQRRPTTARSRRARTG